MLLARQLTWQLPFKKVRKVDRMFTLFESRVLEIVDQRREPMWWQGSARGTARRSRAR